LKEPLIIEVKDGVALLKDGRLDIQDAGITVVGRGELFPPYKVDLVLEARGTDTDLLLSFLPEGVVPGDVVPVGNGSITVDGYLNGELFNRPDMGMDVVCSSFGLMHVPSGVVMDDIGFELYAGRSNSTEPVLGIRDLNIHLPDGAVHADISVENPMEPLLTVDIDADLNLSTLVSFLEFPGSETVSGRLALDIDVAGRFDRSGHSVSREREHGELLLSDFRYMKPGPDFGIQDLDLLFSLAEGLLGIRSLNAVTDLGEISLNGFFGDIWPLILGGDGPLQFGLNIESPWVKPSLLFKDPLVVSTRDFDLEDFSLGLIFNTTAKALRLADPLPVGSYRISDFSVSIPATGKQLYDFSGGVNISSGMTADLKGRFQDSDITLKIWLDGFEYLFKGDEEGFVHSKIVLESGGLTPGNFLPGPAVDDESWLNRRMKDVHLDLDLDFNNSAWFQSPGSWPEGRWILNDFSGYSLYQDLPFSVDFNLTSEDNRAELSSLKLKLGKSRITARGYLNNFKAILARNIQEVSGELSISSEYLDMSDFIYTRGTPDESSPVEWNIGGREYPDVRLDINISDFFMSPFHWKNIGGSIELSPRGILKLNNLSLSGAYGGRTEMKGLLDLSATDAIHLNADARLNGMELEHSFIPMTDGDNTVYLGTVVKGTLTGSAELDVSMKPDLSIDLNRSLISLKAMFEQGRLVDFPPLMAIADKYKNAGLRDVRLDTLRVRVDLSDGQLNIPRTSVGSTLGYLELEGYSRIGSLMSYSVTVPNSVLDDVVRTLVFGNQENPGEHEIINSENSSRGRTTVNVVGRSEDILINLGKRGRKRLEDRWNRRNERRLRRED